MQVQPVVARIIGGVVWLGVAFGAVRSTQVLLQRINRPMRIVSIHVPEKTLLSTGDLVFLSDRNGLSACGEVASRQDANGLVRLALKPEQFAQLSRSSVITCWRTPLSAQNALEALLPPVILHGAMERIVNDWKGQDDRLSEVWGPLIGELSAAYVRLISTDVEIALQRREAVFWHISQWHGRAFLAEWPAIQERLRPKLQQHVTPVLGRLLSEAVTDAPKMSIAWSMARGKQEDAYRIMLDWLTEYLANIPEKDRAELSEAVGRVWDEAKNDPQLTGPVTKLGRGVLEDKRLREALADVYQEAITDNPKTAEFIRDEIINSPRVRKRFFELVEAFAPTARHVASLCLFDENGRTRPEVVHLARSIALRRQMAWVTIEPGDGGGLPLGDREVLRAKAIGSAP